MFFIISYWNATPMFFIISYWNATPMFFLFIAVYVFRVARCATALNSEKAVESLLSLRLFLNLKQAEGPENIYGVLNVFVKIDNSKLKNSKSALPTIQNSKFKIQNSFYPFLPLFFYLFTPFYATTFWVTLFFCSNFATDLATKIIKK